MTDESNRYGSQWFHVFLDTIPVERTISEVDGVVRYLPLPNFRRVLDVCSGPGRHAGRLIELGYDVTGVDRDTTSIARARARYPDGRFIELDQREIHRVGGRFDAAIILWQSFGYFEPAENDRVLRDLASVLRARGRLVLDLFHPGYFAEHRGRQSDTRCRAITNELSDGRLRSTIEYSDGTAESMDWELFTPDELSARAASAGFSELARCTSWDPHRAPTGAEPRYQIVLERQGS